MNHPENHNEGNKPKRQLPPELSFLVNGIPNPVDNEPEELLEHGRRYLALIHRHAALMREYGLDPDRMISECEPKLRDFEQAQQKADKADLELFHAMADRADAMRELFKEMEKLVEAQYAERPFDPAVQEAKEFVDEWRKHMPREN